LVNSKYGNRYRAGWSTIAGTPMLVSTGIGTVYLPVRLGVPPEIRVITLRRGDKRDPR
jgi:predicted MPP superfamily phosphohydrolase